MRSFFDRKILINDVSSLGLGYSLGGILIEQIVGQLVTRAVSVEERVKMILSIHLEVAANPVYQFIYYFGSS